MAAPLREERKTARPRVCQCLTGLPVRGGSFKSGFLAAGFSAVAGNLELGSYQANLVRSSVAGGVGSILGGGKFADGAVTGSFVYIANDVAHRINVRQVVDVLNKLSVLTLDSTRADFEAVSSDLPRFARTLFVAGNIAAGRVLAGNVSLGLAYDRITGEFERFQEVAGGVGYQAGASLEVGFINGSLRNDFFGPSVTFDIDFGKSGVRPSLGFGGGLVVINPSFGRFIWGAYGVPAGYSTAGFAVTFTGTGRLR